MSWREPAPAEREAGERSWEVVRAAYEERIRVPRRRDWRPAVVIALAAALLAAAFSAPGQAVWDSLRESDEDQLLALPTAGRILVNTTGGAWVVQRDGSKRFLSGYADAAWSPHGLYVAAARGNQLVAMEPNGKVHWKVPRPEAIAAPRWSYEGFRIAYMSGRTLRIVNGDGSDDRLLTRDVRHGIYAWEPGTHSLAYVTRAGNIAVVNVDRPRAPAHVRTRIGPRKVEWTRDGRLVAIGRHAVGIFGRRGPQLRRIDSAVPIAAAATAPDGRRLAIVESRAGESVVSVDRRNVFRGAGRITEVSWSPDGRWLLLNWTSADEWLFIRTPVKRIVAVANIGRTFDGSPSLAGWCCP